MSVVYAVTILIPIYYLVISSLKTDPEILSSPLAWPRHLLFGNYTQAIRDAGLTHALGVSIGVTVAAEILTLLLALPAAYAVGRITLPSARVVEAFFGLGFLIPAFAIMVPVFLIAVHAQLLNNPIMLVLFYPAMRLPLSVLVLSVYFRQIPAELEEVAQLDGAGRISRLVHVLLPVLRPGLITVIILNFVEFWNEYLFAFVLLGSDNQTAQVAVPTLASEHSDNFQLLAAGTLVTLIPIYIVFIVFQRRLTEGMLSGAIKG